MLETLRKSQGKAMGKLFPKGSNGLNTFLCVFSIKNSLYFFSHIFYSRHCRWREKIFIYNFFPIWEKSCLSEKLQFFFFLFMEMIEKEVIEKRAQKTTWMQNFLQSWISFVLQISLSSEFQVERNFHRCNSIQSCLLLVHHFFHFVNNLFT